MKISPTDSRVQLPLTKEITVQEIVTEYSEDHRSVTMTLGWIKVQGTTAEMRELAKQILWPAGHVG